MSRFEGVLKCQSSADSRHKDMHLKKKMYRRGWSLLSLKWTLLLYEKDSAWLKHDILWSPPEKTVISRKICLGIFVLASLSTRRNDDSSRAELWLSVQIYLKQVSNYVGKPDYVWNSLWSFEGANCKSAYTSSNLNLTSKMRRLSNECQISTQYFKTLIKLHTKWRWFFKNAVITLTHWVHTHAWSCPIEQLYCWSLASKALLRGPSVVVTREEQVFHSL